MSGKIPLVLKSWELRKPHTFSVQIWWGLVMVREQSRMACRLDVIQRLK